MAIVTCRASNHEHRGWLREQWRRNLYLLFSAMDANEEKRTDAILKFAIGVQNKSREEMQEVIREEEEFGRHPNAAGS